MLTIQATEQDLDQLFEIEETCFSHPWSKDSLRSELGSEHNIFLAAKVEENIIGFCLISVIAGEGTILQVAVHPEYRAKGIGKKLTSAAIEQAKELGTEVIFLEVRVTNTPARRLYQSLGFEKIDLRKGYYRDGENAIIMQWREQNENSGN